MIRKLILTFIAIMFAFSVDSFATHYMGGEITWECLSNGRFKFTLKYYRECYTSNGGSAANFGTTVTLNSTSPAGNITLYRVSWIDISPICNTNPAFAHIICPTSGPGMPNGAANMGAQQEHKYTSDQSYPTGVLINGVPPAMGWRFSANSCCRNPSTNVNGQPSWYLRAFMYPYGTQNTYPCFDNSPTFSEIPLTVICMGYPFTYNHNAYDAELDSLHFQWDFPWQGLNQPVTYSFGYNYTSPLPGTTQNINNVPGVVDPYTGEISFESYTQGAFVTMTKVTAFKCGIKVAEIFREMQVVLLTCGTNNPPNVTAPFQNPVTGLFTEYIDTVFAGDFVSFPMSGTDFEFLPNSTPQTMTIFASGSQFGTGYTSTTAGCLNPPCATLTPPPPVIGQFGVQTTFNWQTECTHLATNAGCGSTSNVYTFLIKTQDDFCPAPAINIATVTIVVMTKPTFEAAEFKCVNVQPNGDVTLTWEALVDTMNTFDSYHLYTSTNFGGPYIHYDSIFNINQTSSVHVGANAQNQQVYYYMIVRSGCDATSMSQSGDTIRTMVMDVTNTGNGTAMLNWNSFINPLPSTSFGWYELYREFPVGVWTLLDSTQTLTYEDTITVCNQFISYRAEIWDSSGCKSVSSIDGDLFQDATSPVLTPIDTVSVDPVSGRAVIGWGTNTSDDTQGYIIYLDMSGVWTPIDTVWGITSNFYIDPVNDPSLGYLSYQIAAFDSCGNTSNLSKKQNTIHLSTFLAVCDYEIQLKWTPYINMDPGLGGYNIYVSENGGPYTLLTNMTATDSIYVHNGLTKDAQYCYFIQAYDSLNTKTSTSNIVCELAHQPGQPQFLYMRYVTVINNEHINLRAFIDTSAWVKEYRIFRSLSSSGPFNLLTTITPPQPAINDYIEFDDHEVYIHEQSYYYKASVIDSCGVEVLESNIGRSILLKASALDNFTNTIEWNDYEKWLGSVSSYNIYRATDDNWGPAPIANLLPALSGMNTFEDPIKEYTETGGKFTYFIEALEGPGNPYFYQDKSISNQAVVEQPPRVFVPNAFSPKGYNSRFYPVAVFVKSDDYIFRIFNRWGQLLYETNIPGSSNGWDGTYEGKFAPAGVYVYYVRFKTATGDYFEKRGTVTVIK
ncbi:gliding motility-associated C-terminal domain-containing protein [Bacteroidota bacterium]